MTVIKKTRGGPREGAGRKPLGDGPMTRYQVMLDISTVVKLRAFGDGNLSAGIRLAARLIDVKGIASRRT